MGIFPNRQSARRLVGAALFELHDEWAEARRDLAIPNAAGNDALPRPICWTQRPDQHRQGRRAFKPIEGTLLINLWPFDRTQLPVRETAARRRTDPERAQPPVILR